MTGLATSSGPTLLGKLRALEERMVERRGMLRQATTPDQIHAMHRARAELADLLPQIIAQIDSDAQDAARYRWLRSGQRLRQGIDIGVGHRRIAKDLTHELMAFSYWCTPEELDAAIDAAKERT